VENECKALGGKYNRVRVTYVEQESLVGTNWFETRTNPSRALVRKGDGCWFLQVWE